MNWTRTVAIGATMGSLAALARIPFAAIPNVQPASALIILAGAAFGPAAGLLTGAVTPLVSNAFLGHGPWTPFQMLAWGLMGLFAAALGGRPGRWALAAYGAVVGLAYGVVMDGWTWLTFVRPLSLSALAPILLRGVPFNILHAAGNAVILAAVGPRLVTLFGRARRRRTVEQLDLSTLPDRPATGASPDHG